MTTPEERGIIWTDSSALAILNTRLGTYPGEAIDSSKPAKWQTRRLLNPQPCTDEIIFDEKTATATFPSERGKRIDLRCPFGVPGDLLYGRECWAVDHTFDNRPPRELDHTPIRFRSTPGGCFRPWLDLDDDYRHSDKLPLLNFGRWRSSIDMPKDFARIWHEIVDVRVEPLRTINEVDSKAEGMPGFEIERPLELPCPSCGGAGVCPALGAGLGVTEIECLSCDTARKVFRWTWGSIHGDQSWAENPWVWVLGLRRIER